MFVLISIIFVTFVAAVLVATISTDKALTTDNRKEENVMSKPISCEVFNGNLYTGGVYAEIDDLAKDFREAYNPADFTSEELEKLIWEDLECYGYYKDAMSKEDQDFLWGLAVEAIFDI